jgi:hypothetical protein
LKIAANGVEYGVSSLRWLPGGSFYDAEEVSGGDTALWDFSKFNSPGITWPALMEAYFVLYDVTLVDIWNFLGVPVFRWKMGSMKTTDADSSSPAGFVNVGPSFSGAMPGHIYLSVGDFAPQAGVSVSRCSTGNYDCIRPLSTDFEMLTQLRVGLRFAWRSSHALSMKLPTPPTGINLGYPKFSNSDALIPLYWAKDFFSVSQLSLHRFLQYELFGFSRGEATVTIVMQVPLMLFCMVWSFNRACTSGSLPMESKEDDTCCK